jgi:hypothetical protein
VELGGCHFLKVGGGEGGEEEVRFEGASLAALVWDDHCVSLCGQDMDRCHVGICGGGWRDTDIVILLEWLWRLLPPGVVALP